MCVCVLSCLEQREETEKCVMYGKREELEQKREDERVKLKQ